ncbi:hypothetical protein GOBAR_AA13486 [Gossypium barbadense]|uniref:Uncharacterized protein n=1 Tax=Gossypium barbadense TaxID=3634 RepID=A0A2P5XUZ2_GOSBA|nr:hypothetical protein GOBAR_AA13486 [Gossypium barbadense]
MPSFSDLTHKLLEFRFGVWCPDHAAINTPTRIPAFFPALIPPPPLAFFTSGLTLLWPILLPGEGDLACAGSDGDGAGVELNGAGAGECVPGEGAGAGECVPGEGAGAGECVPGEGAGAGECIPGEGAGAGECVPGEGAGAGEGWGKMAAKLKKEEKVRRRKTEEGSKRKAMEEGIYKVVNTGYI